MVSVSDDQMIAASISLHWCNTIFSAVAAILIVLLAGCAPVGPEYQAPRTAMPAQWQGGAGSTVAQTDPPAAAWWTLFNDPQLHSLVARSEAANHTLEKAAARVREARAQRTIAAATVSAGGSATASHSRRSENSSSENSSSSGGTQDLFQVGFDAGWELDIFGGVRRSVEAADASLEASYEEYRDVQVSLQAEVARNYLELRGSQKRLATTRKNIITQEKTVAMVRGRFEMGLGNELDLVQAKTQLALLKAQVPPLETAGRQAMHQLAILAGRNPADLIAELSTVATFPRVPGEIPTTLPSELLRQRPDIRAAERRLAASTAGIGVATADLFPKFSLSALLGLQSTGLSDLIAGSSRYWSVGPVLNFHLFDQGKRRAAIEIREAQRDGALADYEQSVLTAIGEVEDGLVAFSREQETLLFLSEAVTSSKKAMMMSKGLFESGLTDFLNVLESERALYLSEDQLVQSEQRLALSLVALYKALGGGWNSETGKEAAIHPQSSAPPDFRKTPSEN